MTEKVVTELEALLIAKLHRADHFSHEVEFWQECVNRGKHELLLIDTQIEELRKTLRLLGADPSKVVLNEV